MKDVKFLTIDISEWERKEIESNFVEYRKLLNRMLSNSRKSAKGDTCMYCEKETSSYCNSHSIPAFCLRNIANNGIVLSSNQLVEFPLIDIEKGVNSAGTFQLICRECDGKIFQEYENPDNYITKPTTKMLAQIVMKNSLMFIGKRLQEHSLYNIMDEKYTDMSAIVKAMHEVEEIDLKEYRDSFKKAKKISEKNFGDEYYLFCYERLDYVVPIAFQGIISLVVDLDNNIINDIYSKSPNYKILKMHVCIFPLEKNSVVMLFIDSKYKRYRNFYKKLNKLSLEDKLSIINYIIFLYSEDIFLSKDLPKEVLENKDLISVAKETGIALGYRNRKSPIEAAKEIYSLNKHKIIPNLLSEKYKLR